MPDLINQNIGRSTQDEFISRSQAGVVKPSSYDESNRSVEVVGATQTPALVWDPKRYEAVEEVLLMSGCRIPKGKKIPLTIEHGRSAEAVIGSFQEMKTEGEKLTGRVSFSSSSDAEPYHLKVKEGHLERFSVYYPSAGRKSVYIAKDQSATIEGKTYHGPLLVTKSWTPTALGLVLFAADDNAKARSQTKENHKEKKSMDKRLRAFLERSGLDADATEDQAWEFLNKLNMQGSEDPSGTGQEDDTSSDNALDSNSDPAHVARSAIDTAIADERTRTAEINSMCAQFSCGHLADDMVRSGLSLDIARQKVMKHLAAQDTPVPVRATIQADEKDKFRSAAGDAMLMRSGFDIEKPASGAEGLCGYSLTELARHALRVSNQQTRGNAMEMIGRALTSTDFPLLLANTVNKSLQQGWEEAEETWRTWCGTGSVSDFKKHSRPRLSEAADLDLMPEKMPYKYGERSEEQEEYQIATYGKMEAITRQTIINDDLGAFTDIPRSHGEAASRKVGDVAWAALLDNALMGDGRALFHAKHNNLNQKKQGPVGVEILGNTIAAMKQQKDMAGKRRLNIRPIFFVAPTALEGSCEVFFRSEKFDDDSASATRANPYAGKYFNRIYEPRLDDFSETAWYLSAARGKTIKVFFLNGVQKPYVEQTKGWSVDGVEYKVRIDVGAKAMDWRGLQRNDG
ncbi:MAG: hypothetical protein GY874_17885 [Desulfobacteraceae bacterium]|nr:hypothetical protein [Desulfobacteraceae bacterium]